MTNRFLLSVAAVALIAGTGFAYAQGTGMSKDTLSGPAHQGAASTERSGSGTAPMQQNEDSESKGKQSAQSEERKGKVSKNRETRDGDMKHGKMENEKSAQDTDKRGMDEKSNSMRSETKTNSTTDKNMKAEGRNEKTEDLGQMNAEDRNGTKSNSKSAAEGKGSTTTTGQAGAHAKLSTEQRTKITTVIKNEHIRPETNVNFSISVGTRVPREMHFHPLPTEIVTIYPDWRGYEFFLVRDEIIVVNPRTLEIVAVLEA
jgi:hypothetical protein